MFFMVHVSKPSLFSFKCVVYLYLHVLMTAMMVSSWCSVPPGLDPSWSLPGPSSWFLVVPPHGSSWFLLVPPGSSSGGLFLVVPPLVLSLWFLLGWSFPCGPSPGPCLMVPSWSFPCGSSSGDPFLGPSLWFPLALVLSLSLSLSLPSSCLPLL